MEPELEKCQRAFFFTRGMACRVGGEASCEEFEQFLWRVAERKKLGERDVGCSLFEAVSVVLRDESRVEHTSRVEVAGEVSHPLANSRLGFFG